MTDQKKLENCDSASAKETCFNYAERKQFIQKLFRQHYRQMYRLATILLHDDAVSKDVVHDIFAQLLNDSKDLKEDTAESYLFTCVRNRCLNVIRSRQIHEASTKAQAQETMKRTDYKLSLVDSGQPSASVPTLPTSKNRISIKNI